MLRETIRVRSADPMTSEGNRQLPASTEVSSREIEVELRPSTHANGAQERLEIGQLLGGRYRIERELGEGGMGVVYLAADEQVVGETFAIKVLKGAVHPEAI